MDYNDDGSIDKWSAYEYEYDNQGNITKSIYSLNGSFSEWNEYTYDFRGITPQRIVFNENNFGIQAPEL